MGVAADGIADVLGASLGREPRSMDADDHEFIRILVGEVIKILDDTQTAQRAVGIEVEKNDSALLLAQPDRTVDVEPVQLVRDFRNMALLLEHRKKDPGMLPDQPCY